MAIQKTIQQPILTENICLAATLLHEGYAPDGVKVAPHTKHAEFRFPNNTHTKIIAEQFWLYKCRVEPQTLLNHIKNLKSQIRSIQ